jgi:glycosyltransferase involved in cell wall biosynthesis
MRRVLFLNLAGEIGGAERSLLDLLASLRQANPSLELSLLLAGDGPLRGRAERLGVAITVLPMPDAVRALGDSGLRGAGRWRSLATLAGRGAGAIAAACQYARRLRQFVDALRPDVVHSNSIKFHLLTRLARLHGRLVVWHVRDFLGARPLMARALRYASGGVGAVAISQAVGADVRKVLPGVPVAVVYNAIDTEEFSPGPGDGAWLDCLAGLPPAGPDVVRVGLVATYARWKGQDVFLEAAARAAQNPLGKAVRFYLVGGPIYHTAGSQWSDAELRELGRPLLDTGQLGFVPFQQEPAAVYRALDVVVHASTLPEPFGRTIVEAMACGRAVVVTCAGGAAELFTDDYDAAAVPPRDPEALALAIKQLVDDSAPRIRLGQNALQTAARKFGRPRLGPQVLATYETFHSHRPLTLHAETNDSTLHPS